MREETKRTEMNTAPAEEQWERLKKTLNANFEGEDVILAIQTERTENINGHTWITRTIEPVKSWRARLAARIMFGHRAIRKKKRSLHLR